MMIGPGLVLVTAFGLVLAAAQAPVASRDCGALAAADADSAAYHYCLGDDARARGDRAPAQSSERRRDFERAVDEYRRSANAAEAPAAKIRALVALADVYSTARLSEPVQLELTLQEWMRAAPSDPTPMFRLAQLQEESGLIEPAEDTLVAARRLAPDQVEPYRRLAQFYVRRATSVQKDRADADPHAEVRTPGPDADGVYRVGDGLEPPKREDMPRYPEDAKRAGVQGVVQVEIVIDEAGRVRDARVVRSVPMLDQAALDGVRRWRFDPTLVNGKPVAVRMVVMVNFRP